MTHMANFFANINKSKWPADRIVYRAVENLSPYTKNARVHSPEQVRQIADSIREWGFTVPVLVDEQDVLIAGHGRVLAAKLLGLPDVPAMVASGWTEEQIRAYRIADNKLTLNGGWDDEALKFELGELQADGFDLGLTGFGEAELMGLLGATPGLTDPDDAPEPPAEPITQPGDVWLLGRHRLVCGDATKAEDVARCLNGVAPHLMVTDPPYGVEYDPAWRSEASKRPGKFRGSFHSEARAVGIVQNDERADWSDAWTLFPGDVAYVWHSALQATTVAQSLTAGGFNVRSQIIWEKQHFIIGRGDYHWQHEPCWYAVRQGRVGHWSGDRRQSTIWQIHSQIGWESARPDNKDKATGHSTQKPVECMRRPIENNSSPGQAVYDPFVGSGTTIIAAEMTGRACHAIELSPAYCDVAVLRWQAFTGQVAIHAESNKSLSASDAETRAGAAAIPADG